MKRLLLALVAVVAALVGTMAVRAAMVPAPAAPAVAEKTVVVDEATAAQRLSGAVKFATVSTASGGPIDTAAFLGFHGFLATSFPRVHASLQLEKIAGLSLLYTWTGTDSLAPPVVLMGHMDVVPVPSSEPEGVDTRAILRRRRGWLRVGPRYDGRQGDGTGRARGGGRSAAHVGSVRRAQSISPSVTTRKSVDALVHAQSSTRWCGAV